jgi:hypothetical protein
VGTTEFKTRDWAVRFLGLKFGYEQHRIHLGGEPYMDRYMLSLGFQLRLHKFWRGDDDRAPHDHMWTFWTFPFASYVELVASPGATGYFENDRDWWTYESRVVEKFRFHRRDIGFKHIVVGRLDESNLSLYPRISREPFWTFVVTGPKKREWGFWRTPATFVPHEQWPR